MKPLGAHAAVPRPLVVGLGEVLFDCFEDREVLGGAPINVAIHADAVLGPGGGAGVPVTRVGDDNRGARFFAEAGERGLDTRYVQTDPDRPTGRVTVQVGSEGQATYDFDSDSAWDALSCDAELASLAGRCDAVAFGTLSQRSSLSRDAIREFLRLAPQALRLFDVNLRQSFYDAETIDASLRLASAAKLNDEELDVVSRLLDLGAAPADERVHTLAAAYGLGWVAITRGGDGASLYVDGMAHEGAPAPFNPQPNADTVGAGDACCAGLICGSLLGLPIAETLSLANRMGAYVAERAGATPTLPSSVLAGIDSPSRTATKT